MARLKSGITAAAIALGCIAAANGVAYAATGHAFVLGVSNTASTTTTLARTTAGAPLALNARAGSAPLAVNSSTRVARLNADMVDGLHAANLQLHAIEYKLPLTAPNSPQASLPGLVPGVYLASYAAEIYSATANDQITCSIEDAHNYPRISSQITLQGHYGIATSSGVLDARVGTFRFNCGGGVGPAHLLADGNSVLDLTRISSLTITNAAP